LAVEVVEEGRAAAAAPPDRAGRVEVAPAGVAVGD